jgi:putative membrane protein
LTLGLFSLILNGLFFWFVASLISGFSVATFKAALIGALIVSILNWLGNKLVGGDE